MLNKIKTKEIRKIKQIPRQTDQPHLQQHLSTAQQLGPTVEQYKGCPYCSQEILQRVIGQHIKICGQAPENNRHQKQQSRNQQEQNQQQYSQNYPNVQGTFTQTQGPRPQDHQHFNQQQPNARTNRSRGFFMENVHNLDQDFFESPRQRAHRNVHHFSSSLGIDEDSIFGPNGIFTQSMNQMNVIMNQSFNNINRPNMHPTGHTHRTNFGDNSFFTNVFTIPRQTTYFYSSDVGQQQRQGMNRNDINSVPTTVYREPPNKKDNQNTMNKNCVICMSDFQRGDNLKTLPCTHKFHNECLDQWLQIKGECPICRFSMI